MCYQKATFDRVWLQLRLRLQFIFQRCYILIAFYLKDTSRKGSENEQGINVMCNG